MHSSAADEVAMLSNHPRTRLALYLASAILAGAAGVTAASNLTGSD